MTFREFTDGDWQDWTGAQEFADGSRPRIAETEDWVVILDGTGITATDADGVNFLVENPTLTPTAAERLVEGIDFTSPGAADELRRRRWTEL